MNWQHWIVVGVMALSSILNITAIGQPRKPITPGLAAGIVVSQVSLILLIVAGQ